jgi:hypothetical protein
VTGTALKKPVNTRNVQATTMSNGDTDELTARIDRLEHEIAKLRSERETALTGWPNEPTIAQGFMAGRWQRRDGDGYTQGLANIPEAPFDTNYYGRYQYTWQPVVEEAPALTARRSVTGWARASAGSAVTWISMDAVLVNYVPEVPVGAAAYARVRDGTGGVGWSDVSALGYLPTSGGQMTGPLIARDGGSATNPGLALGDNSTGFYRNAGLLVTTVSGAIAAQIQATLAAWFVDLNVTGHKINDVGSPTLPGDALNLGTADARYAPIGSGGGNFLPLSGGVMTGQLTTQQGQGVGSLSLAIGDPQTGFFRDGDGPGAGLFLMVSGYQILQLTAAREMLINGPLSVGAYPIHNVANPTADADALNRQSGDTRYLQLAAGGMVIGPLSLYSNPVIPNDVTTKAYVDASIAQARAPAVIWDIVNDVLIAGDGGWHELVRVPFTLARTGLSRLQVTLFCNMSGVNNVACVGARLAAGGIERRMFAFGAPPTASCGFTCSLYFDTSPGLINIPVELSSLPLGSAPVPFTILGGSVPERSQIVIVDLGPVA